MSETERLRLCKDFRLPSDAPAIEIQALVNEKQRMEASIKMDSKQKTHCCNLVLKYMHQKNQALMKIGKYFLKAKQVFKSDGIKKEQVKELYAQFMESKPKPPGMTYLEYAGHMVGFVENVREQGKYETYKLDISDKPPIAVAMAQRTKPLLNQIQW